jgi:pyridoxine 5-phosphate synthase
MNEYKGESFYMAELGVNVDHVATIRQARLTRYPDPVTAAALAEMAGASQITVHLREDRRHIQERDVRLLRDTVQTRLNLEMANTAEMIKIAMALKPNTVTLVPERREELTTEGGLEVNLQKDGIGKAIGMLRDADIRTFLFVDPDLDQIKAAHLVSANGVEIHTGRYCNAKGQESRLQELDRLQESVRMAQKLKLQIAAGHGLDYSNITAVAQIPAIEEFNIGHSIIARAVLVGMKEAVAEMVRLISTPYLAP